jgi:hypothetical protein
MFPFWMDSFWGSLPQLMALLATAVVVVLHMVAGYR